MPGMEREASADRPRTVVPVALLNLLRGQTRAAQAVDHEIGFPEDIAVDVVRKPLRQLFLQSTVTRGGLRVRAKVVAHCDLIDDTYRAFRTDIEIVPRQPGRVIERLAIVDPEIAAMHVAKRRQPFERLRHIVSSRDD